MRLEDRCRMFWSHFPSEAIAHGLGLARVGNRAEDCRGFHDLADGHRDRLAWDMAQRGEPSFAHLLFTAGIIEVHNKIWCRGVEVRWGIIEGKVTIFADPCKADINLMLSDQRADAAAFRRRIALAVDVVEGLER